MGGNVENNPNNKGLTPETARVLNDTYGITKRTELKHQIKAKLAEMLSNGQITEEQAKATLVGDGYGGVGTREAFANREKYLDEWIERVKTECTPEEIFTYEYNNYECAYTCDYSDALKIVHRYFPKYQPGKRLLNKLYKGCNLNY